MRRLRLVFVLSLLLLAGRKLAASKARTTPAPESAPPDPAPIDPDLVGTPSVAVERELKLGAPDDFHLDDGATLAGLRADPATREVLDATYYDAPDLRLARSGCTVRHRSDEGWSVKLPTRTGSAGLSRPEVRLPGGPAEPPAAVLALLRAHLRRSGLVPVARLRTTRAKRVLRDGEGTARAELVDDRVEVDRDGEVERFREIEVELVGDTADRMLDALADALVAHGAVPAAQLPKLVRALGEAASAPPPVVVPRRRRRATAEDVVRRAVAEAVARYLAHDPGLVAGEDPEDVHQARVALRRLRSDLRTFSSLLDPEWCTRLRREAGWLAGHLGAVRDAEVLRDRLLAAADALPQGDAPGVRALVARLEAARLVARQDVLTARESPRFGALMDELVAAAGDVPLTVGAARPGAEVIGGLVARSTRRVAKAVGRLPPDPPDESLHGLRILAKRLRYAAEAGAQVGGRRMRRVARRAAELQDVLGEHQDATVLRAWLAAAARSATPEEAFVAGKLHEVETAAASDARARWRPAWLRLSRAAERGR